MRSIFSSIIIAIVIVAAIASVLFLIGSVFAAKGVITKEELKRALISAVVFTVIYLGSEFVIGSSQYNVYVKAIEFLAAVVGAGCYWVGSNPR